MLAAYRFLRNRQVNLQGILTPDIEASIERIRAHRIVLVPQDTTTLNYSYHPATEGLGPVNTTRDQAVGLMLHDSAAFSIEWTPPGILDARCWARDPDEHGKSEERKHLPIEEKTEEHCPPNHRSRGRLPVGSQRQPADAARSHRDRVH